MNDGLIAVEQPRPPGADLDYRPPGTLALAVGGFRQPGTDFGNQRQRISLVLLLL